MRRHAGFRARPDAGLRVLLCAHVASEKLFGGERSFLDMAEGLAAMGAEVFATVPKGSSPAYITALRKHCGAVFDLPYGWWRAGTAEEERVIADFCAILAQEKISAVHANTIMLREPLTAARRMGLPALIHVRELVSQDPTLCERIGLPPERILAEVAARADLLIVNSRFTAQEFGGLAEGKVALAYNTAEIDGLAALPGRPDPARLRVGMISSNLPKKGLAAFAALARRLQDDARLEFRLIGPENKHTAAMPKGVQVLGYRETPAQAIAELDLVLSLSDFYESFGRTVLEAQAAGRPALVWDRGAPPELLRDGETGRIIPAGDLDALTAAITELADDPALYARMSNAARQHAQSKFSPRAFAESLKTAYATLGRKQPGGAAAQPGVLAELWGDLKRGELRASGLFDADWYCRHYADVPLSGLSPEDHFRAFGDPLERNPGPGFDAKAYLNRYGDLSQKRPAPLRHYIRFGRAEGRQITPVMDKTAPPPPVAPLPQQAPAALALPAAGLPVLSDRVRRHAGFRARSDAGLRVLLCAHVASEKLFGGERSFLDMAEGLAAMGAEVFATVPKGSSPAYITALRKHCGAVFDLPYGWWRAGTAEEERVIADFCAILAQEKISAVHANTIMLREPLTAARRMGLPALIHVRELVSQDPTLCERIGLPPERILAEVAARADLLIVNSRFTAQEFGGLAEGKVALAYNTAEIDGLAALPGRPDPARLRVGMISSNLPKKGLAAFAALARRLQDDARLEFRLIGPENKHTAAMPKGVQVLGYRETPAQAIAELDLVLSLSDFYESFGRTVLEAQAAGRPALVWDRGAPPELLRDGETGRIIPAGDLDALTAAITELADDPALYARMSNAARQHAQSKFSPRAFAESLKTAYATLQGHAPQRLTLPARQDMRPVAKSDLRLAYFVWHFPVRSETFVLNELRLLRQQGHDVIVFCKGSPQPDFTPDFDIRWESVRDADHLARRLTETGRTMCHAHFVYPTVTNMLWPACEKAGVPFTFIPHAQDIFRYKNDEANRIGEVARSAACKAVFIPSLFHKTYLEARGVPTEKMILNPNGCDVRLYADGANPRRATRPFRRISAIHRFAEKKGLENLIRAARDLQQDGITIAIHGYGELEDAYRRIIREEKLTNVEIHGPVASREAMLEIFRSSDLFACPSVRAADGDMDGIPTVLMEAMSARLPVLTTALSGIPDLVSHEVTGIVCDADPGSIAARIRGYYAMSDSAVDGMIEAAHDHVERHFNSEYLIDILLRVWTNNRVDLLIVSWNGPRELAEVLARLRRNTSLPYHLIVCDNGSGAETLSLLQGVYADEPSMTLLLNRDNALVGPGTNHCLALGRGEYAIYVCGKEGMTTGWGWEKAFVETLRAAPEVGLAGTIGYSPSYLTGRDYPKGVAPFAKFRNQGYAMEQADRVFGHVQGGLFGIRRAMVDAIGGFSEAVPHNHTDVEYSYYVESCGWKLGTVDGAMALYNKTRPALAHRVDEHHLALHPPTLEDLPMFDRITRGEVNHCNICGQSSPQFRTTGDDTLCPHCGSTRRARSIFRVLAESTLLYRRLPALAVDLPASLQAFWTAQFQGKALAADEILAKGSGFSERRLALVGLLDGVSDPKLLAEACRVLAPGGTLLIANAMPDPARDQGLIAQGLIARGAKRYGSRVLDFDPAPVLIYERPKENPGRAKAAR
ncbi:glycosyltransferase [Xinfangfangia pollutisoli]|uniref:glycosyltransferase n=1 Tax=Xinfangfangia pollutisoli TaxID=2865960 RepID=UPI001CD81642|nr:glycosyltransferase [Xinfangfangia pollutisoli]